MSELSRRAAAVEEICRAGKLPEPEIAEQKVAALESELQRICRAIASAPGLEHPDASGPRSGKDQDRILGEVIRALRDLPEIIRGDLLGGMTRLTELKAYTPRPLSAEAYEKVYDAAYECDPVRLAKEVEQTIAGLSEMRDAAR